MIYSVAVTNDRGDKLLLELRNPERSGFQVCGISGIGPIKALINMTEISTMDGTAFNSARIGSRNIVMQLAFLGNSPDEIETLRQKSYKYFPVKKEIELLFTTDNRVARIKGYVESNEPVIFSKLESTQISIICPDPKFYSAGSSKNVTIFYGIEPMFEFPFENNSLDSNLIEFGRISRATEANIKYDGDSDIGVTMIMHAAGAVSNITIYNVQTKEHFKIYTSKIESLTGKPFSDGDDIIINTNDNNKMVMLLRNGEYINIINAIDRKSCWFKLSKGDNVFAYVAESGLENLYFKIENDVVYEGI